MRALMVGVGLVLVMFSLSAVFSGCAEFNKSQMSECRSLCANEKVELYKDDTQECRCKSPHARD